jgi:hypothetical protein
MLCGKYSLMSGTKPSLCDWYRGAQPKLTAGAGRRLSMTKILIGMATAALWFMLAHAANAAPICRAVCELGSSVACCVQP